MKIYENLYSDKHIYSVGEMSQHVGLRTEELIVPDEQWLLHRFLRIGFKLRLNVL